MSSSNSQQLPVTAKKFVDRAKNSSVRLISKYPKSSDSSNVVPFIKFGPLFGQDDQDFVRRAKEEAWQYVVNSSKSKEAIVTEIYMSSMRKIENIAKASYAPDSALDKLSNKDFRDTMLKDGCLFLQLLFSLLDVKLNDFPHLRNNNLTSRKQWVESMLHVGNQIPMVVLRELLKKSYFRELVKNRKWKEPSIDLAKKGLFRVVLSPELYNPPPKWCIKFLSCVGKHARWMQQLKECRDLLHGIHLYLLGPEIDPKKEEYHDDDDDDDDDDFGVQEEENTSGVVDINTNVDDGGTPDAKNGDDGNDDDDDDNDNFKNVIKLKQAGVHFGITKEGIRGIEFKSNLIYPKLYLPPLFVGTHTRLLLQNVKQYEVINLDPSLREVSSYLEFMRDLVHTTQDAKILSFYGIVKGKRKYTQMLPTILVDLTRMTMKTMTPPHREKRIRFDTSTLNPVKMEINSFYRPVWVSSYFTIVFLLSFLGMLISIVQTVYAILAYHKPPPSD